MKFNYLFSVFAYIFLVNAENSEKTYPQPTPIINTRYQLIPVPSPTSKRLIKYNIKHTYPLKKYRPINFKPLKPCNFGNDIDIDIDENDDENEHCYKINKEKEEEEIIYVN